MRRGGLSSDSSVTRPGVNKNSNPMGAGMTIIAGIPFGRQCIELLSGWLSTTARLCSASMQARRLASYTGVRCGVQGFPGSRALVATSSLPTESWVIVQTPDQSGSCVIVAYVEPCGPGHFLALAGASAYEVVVASAIKAAPKALAVRLFMFTCPLI